LVLTGRPGWGADGLGTGRSGLGAGQPRDAVVGWVRVWGKPWLGGLGPGPRLGETEADEIRVGETGVGGVNRLVLSGHLNWCVGGAESVGGAWAKRG
jgi:hypothetical protein